MIPEDREAPLQSNEEVGVPTLEDLLAGVTRENLHPEINTGVPVGEEMWQA